MQTNSGCPRIESREADSPVCVCANFRLAAARSKNRECNVINLKLWNKQTRCNLNCDGIGGMIIAGEMEVLAERTSIAI